METVTTIRFSTWKQNAYDAASRVIVAQHQNAIAGGWREDMITFALLVQLESLGTSLIWPEYGQRVTWRGLKYVGGLEQRFGDIAVFVQLRLNEHVSVEGVAYYEAKKQYFTPEGERLGFRSLKLQQLTEIQENTHASHVLLYDIGRTQTGFQGAAQTLPTSLVVALMRDRTSGRKTRHIGNDLYSHCRTWIDALGNNLRGFELDFSPAGVQSVRENVLRHLAVTVIEASVSRALELEPHPPKAELPGYIPLKSEQSQAAGPQDTNARYERGAEM